MCVVLVYRRTRILVCLVLFTNFKKVGVFGYELTLVGYWLTGNIKLNFQTNAVESAFYLGGEQIDPLIYCVIGLTEEAGEVAGKVKKLYRDHDGKIDDEYRTKLALELGDTLWYLSVLANKAGLDLETVAQLNIEKRLKRKENGTQRGNGDNR